MRAVKPNDVHYFLGDFCMGSQTRSPCLSATNSLHEDLRGARKSRQAGAQVERGILLARQSGWAFDPRSPNRALSLRLARLEPLQSWIMAPLWTSCRGVELTLHGCGSRHARFPSVAF